MEPPYRHRTIPCFQFLYKEESSEIWALTAFQPSHVFSIRIDEYGVEGDERYEAVLHRWKGEWHYAGKTSIGAGQANHQISRVRCQAMRLAYALSGGKVYKSEE